MKIEDLIRYIIVNYPYPNELSKARLNKIIYLIDWKSAIERYRSLTEIFWLYNNYGPYVRDIEEHIRMDKRFLIEISFNFYGAEKSIIKLKDDVDFNEPFEEEKKIIDFVIDKTKTLYYSDFIQLVYSTYPIINCQKGEILDLPKLAKEYEEYKNLIMADKN